MAEVHSLPLTSSKLLPKLPLALSSELSPEDSSQLFFHVLFLCAIFSGYIIGLRGEKIKVPRGNPEGTVRREYSIIHVVPCILLQLVKVEPVLRHTLQLN